MSFPICSSSGFYEAIIEREIVPDRVPPSRAPVAEVRKVVQHVLVDICQHQLLLGVAEDGHADQSNVGVLRLWLLWKRNTEQPRI